MRDDRPIGAEACSRALETDPAGIEARLKEELKKLGRKIVVLDDDPTGIQTVHDVYVYTDWKQETLEEAFQDQNSMFFYSDQFPGDDQRGNGKSPPGDRPEPSFRGPSGAQGFFAGQPERFHPAGALPSGNPDTAGGAGGQRR